MDLYFFKMAAVPILDFERWRISTVRTLRTVAILICVQQFE